MELHPNQRDKTFRLRHKLSHQLHCPRLGKDNTFVWKKSTALKWGHSFGSQKLQMWLNTSVNISHNFLGWKLPVCSWMFMEHQEKDHIKVETSCFFCMNWEAKVSMDLKELVLPFCVQTSTLGEYYSLKHGYSLSHSNRNPPILRSIVLTHKPAFRYANNSILLSAGCPIIFPLFHLKGVSVLCSWQWICKEEFEKARPARTAASASLIAGMADVRRCIRRLGC